MLGAIVLSIFATSCTKDALDPSTNKVDSTAVDQLLAELDPAAQSFTIDPSHVNEISGEDGTVITIPANAFVDEKGAVVIVPVTITLKEILTVKDQLLSKINSSSNDSVVKSIGSFFFEASVNGKKLELGINQSLTFKIPAVKVDTTMKVFVGNNKLDSAFDWIPVDSNLSNPLLDTVGGNSDTSNVNSYSLHYGFNTYELKVHSLYKFTSFNLGQYYDYSNPNSDYYSTIVYKLPCTVSVAGGKKEAIDFKLDVVYRQFNMVGNLQTPGVVSSNIVIDANELFFLGKEATIIIVGIGKSSKKPYFGKSTFTVAANSTPSINIIQMSNEEMFAALNNI